MQTTESVTIAAPPSEVFPHVAELDAYPAWLEMVHSATPDYTRERPAWWVELRARVGPFARSKQLRMERTERVVDELAVFERVELDGRDHAGWVLRAELGSTDDGGTRVTMHLSYDGRLWGGLLARVLDDEIRRGRDGLERVVSGGSTR